jgi:UDP-N-acetylglucosamine:LPS N-acetylglucosamine transferase
LKYLQKENAAFCVDDFSTLHEVLLNIANNPEIIIDYANKAWKCGKRNHQIEIIRQDLYNDFVRLISLN